MHANNTKAFFKALLFSIFCVGFTYLLFAPNYLTNDDPGYAMIISGKMVFNQPTAYILFEHIFYTSFIQFLYHQNPAIAWYPLVQVGLLFCCLLIHNFYLFKQLKPRTALLTSLLLYICFFGFFFVTIHFTLTSFVLGLTAFSILLRLRDSQQQLLLAVTAIVLLVFSAMIRWEAWQFVMIWMVLYFFVMFIYQYRKKALTLPFKLCFGLIVISILLGFTLYKIDDYCYVKSGNAPYREFNFYRAHLNDYHDLSFLTKEERLAIIKKQGWSNNDYRMTMYWMFLDFQLFSPAKIKAIILDVDQSKLQAQRIKLNLKNFGGYLDKNENLKFLFVVCLGVLLLFDNQKRGWVLFFIGQFLMALTTIVKKYPPESFYTATFLMLPYFLVGEGFHRPKKKLLLICLCLFAFYQISNYVTISNKNKIDEANFSRQVQAVGSDTTHIYFNWGGLNSAFIKPFDNRNLNAKNILFIGTFGAHPLNKEKIHLLGIENLMLEIATNQRILVLFKPYNQKFKKEINFAIEDYKLYVKEHTGMQVNAKLIDQKYEMSIWDFSVVAPADSLVQ
jgi:hypothetical protein